MRFVSPELLWLWLTLPLLAALAWWSVGRRRATLSRFAAGNDFTRRFSGEVSPHRRAVKSILLLGALAALIAAAARPQWGTRLEPINRAGIDVVVVLDHSLSMAAEDLGPSRLDLARESIDVLLSRLAGNRIGLVTFAGQPSLACPLTLDHAAVRLFLDAVEVETAQVPGTALGDALRLAVGAFSGETQHDAERGRAVLLFTDGEDHEGKVDEVFEELQAEGIAVYAVGVGTSRGGPIPLKSDDGGVMGYKKDREDKVVTTRLDEALLEQLALSTRGRYHRATAAGGEIDPIVEALTAMDAREFGSVLRTRYEERFQIPLALALVLLLADTVLGDRAAGARRSE